MRDKASHGVRAEAVDVPAFAPMSVQALAVLAVLSGTALPLSALTIHSLIEARIPSCPEDRPAAELLCVEPVTGLKFDSRSART